MEAYEVARDSMEGHLKLIIKEVQEDKDKQLNASWVSLTEETQQKPEEPALATPPVIT